MFNFLKNKLKEWVDKTKEKLKTEEKSEEEVEKKEEESEVSEDKEQIEKKYEEVEKKEIFEDKELKEEKESKEVEKKEKEEESKTEENIQKESFIEKIGKIFKREKKEEISIDKKEEVLKEKEEKEEEILEKEKPKKESFLKKIKSVLVYKINEKDFNEVFEDLEILLLENNVAFEAVCEIKKRLSKELIGKEIKKEELENEIKKELKKILYEILIDPDDPLEVIKVSRKKPFIILFFGINGTGKTTSIAKFANLLKKNNLSVVIAAADTFRAASIEQISEHAKKLNVPVIKQEYGADPAAVAYDSINYAKSHKIDVVLIDSAGRMHTQINLLKEMEKIARVTNPDLKIFVAESIAGNDAIEQAKIFNEKIGIDGCILTKADVDEKGGTIISISYITKKPIFYLGTGQNFEDLELFRKEEYINKLGL